MDGLANGAETMVCPHCGKEMRRGMIRCRECGKGINDAAGDFELSGHELVAPADALCPLCGATLEPGTSDCPACTSALLDQLLQGPAPGPAVPAPHAGSPARPTAPSQLRVQRAPTRKASAQVSAPGSTKPRGTAPAAGPGKPAAQYATPGNVRNTPPPRAPASKPASAPELPAVAQTDTDSGEATTPVETTAACTALLASLSTADSTLRCEIATALGKLGDKAALGPLDRFMGDPDIRVRRAVAAALVQLGHEKGETLLDIAERVPAAMLIAAAKGSKPAKKSSGGGGMNVDPGMLLKLVGGLAAVALVGGGIWWAVTGMGSSGPKPKAGKKSGKSAATAKKTSPSSKKPSARARTDD